jgi:hypothetical protein
MRLFVLPLLVLLAMVTAASPASAQVDCAQYPDDPECQGDVGPTGGDTSSNPVGVPFGLPGAGFAGPSGDIGSGSGGELPFTGYPVSPLIIFALLLLLLGLAARAAQAAGRKARERYESSG